MNVKELNKSLVLLWKSFWSNRPPDSYVDSHMLPNHILRTLLSLNCLRVADIVILKGSWATCSLFSTHSSEWILIHQHTSSTHYILDLFFPSSRTYVVYTDGLRDLHTNLFIIEHVILLSQTHSISHLLHCCHPFSEVLKSASIFLHFSLIPHG